VDEEWFAADQPEWREQIIVPFCWESLAAWGEAEAAGNDNYYSTRVFLNPLDVTRANHRSALRYEVGWYRRVIEIPRNSAWENKRVILTIGAADFFTDCWCNGIHIGHHEGGYTPFEFDLTDALRRDPARRALIVLRVEDPMDNSEQPVGKQWRWYTTTSGIWQTVFIEPRNNAHIKSFRITPNITAGTAHFRIECPNTPEGSIVKIGISSSEENAGTGDEKRSSAHEHEAQVRGGVAEKLIKIDPLQLWDPNAPHLYPVILELSRNGKISDAVRTYFGMRKIDFELSEESGVPTSLRLNGVARYLRGALYQSYHPDGVYTATSEETLKNDIVAAKRFGFNFLRVHIKLDDPILLYWADKLGILLMADFPNFGEGGDTALGRRRFEQMMREGIERDFNHPSIFAWCLFNETWGFGGQTSFLDKLLAPVPGITSNDIEERAHEPLTFDRDAENLAGQRSAAGKSRASGPSGSASAVLEEPPPSETQSTPARKLVAPQVWVQKIWELAKQLDPTRLVEDMSVCQWDHLEYYQHCDTDINSWHFYINDYEKAKAHIEKIVRSTFIGSSFNYVPGFLHKGQPLINSEYGGIGALDGDRDVSWSFKFLTNELRRHQQIAAYIYTELHDVEWEYNGFLNYDRTPKEFGYDPRIVNESNALPVDGPPVQRVAPGEAVRLDVDSAHFSMKRYEHVSLCWHMAGIDTLGRLHQDLASGRVRIPFPHREVDRAHTIEMRMPDTCMLCTLMIEAQSERGKVIARNFVHYFVASQYPPKREATPRALVLRGLPDAWSQAVWSGGTAERDKERAEDCCYGFGHGFFEWELPLNEADLARARRIKVLCEASAHRVDAPQTDQDNFPTTFQMSLNDVAVHQSVLRNHPHDARGVLSYWRGGVGAYGYLIHAVAEKRLLEKVVHKTENKRLRLRCAVPEDALAQGGLTIYGAECGRFPVCPTVIVEW
jgi:hypothetical protein